MTAKLTIIFNKKQFKNTNSQHKSSKQFLKSLFIQSVCNNDACAALAERGQTAGFRARASKLRIRYENCCKQKVFNIMC